MRKKRKSVIMAVILSLLFLCIYDYTKIEVEAVSSLPLQNQVPIAEMRIDSATNSSSAWGWKGTHWNWGLTFLTGIVYCLTPTIGAGWGSFYTADIQAFENLPPSLRNRLWSISYFGYGFEGDKSPWRYLAAQELFWEAVPLSQFLPYGGDGTFNISWTGKYGENISEINRYKEEIESLIRTMNFRPSFSGKTIEAKLNETIVLSDSNSVLDRFRVTVGSGVEVVSKTATELRLKITSPDFDSTVSLEKKYQPSNNSTIIWQLSGKQPLLSPGIDNYDPLTSTISLKLSSGNFELTKLDENGNPVKDVVFRIRGSDYRTDANGKIRLNDIALGDLTYQEISVPSPIIIDTTVKSTTINSGVTTSVIVTNQVGKGIIEVIKKSEEGKSIQGVVFDVKDSSGKVVSTITSNPQGIAKTGELSLGSYTITEKSVPKEYKLNTPPQTVTLRYKDSTTRVVSISATFINEFQPVAKIGVERIRIDTQKASQGLKVEGWFSKNQLYDWFLNGFRNASVKVDVYSKSSGGIVASKTYTVETFPDYDTYDIPSAILQPDQVDTYEIRISVQESNKVAVSERSQIATYGYTASEESILQDAKNGTNVHTEYVIRTERYYGQEMETWKETFDITVPKLAKIRTGRGFAYDVKATYSNELNQDYSIELTFKPDTRLVDGDFYERTETQAIIPLTLTDGQYRLPHVYSKIGLEGTIVDEQTAITNQSAYRDGYHKVYIPFWSTDLETYETHLVTNKIGVHQIEVDFTDQQEVFAFFFGTKSPGGSSPTIDKDGIVISPVHAVDNNNNGIPDNWDSTGRIPDNWGVTLDNGTKVLTLAEKEFLGVLGTMSLSYDLNGGTGNISGSDVVEGEYASITAQVPTRYGHTFDGWLNPEDGKIYKSENLIQILGNTKLIAQWKQSVFTVVFNMNGGSGTITAQSVAYGAKAAIPTNPVRNGYTFAGWSPDISQSITKDTTFVAQWTQNRYTVSYDAAGGTDAPATSTVNHGTSITIGKAPMRIGYTFAGWKSTTSGNTYSAGISGFIVTSNATFVAQWRAYTHTVNFNLNGGSGNFASFTKQYGTRVYLPSSKPTRNGYAFTGWKDSKTGQIWQAGSNYTNDYNGGSVTLTAQWSQTHAWITYNASGGSGGAQTGFRSQGYQEVGAAPTRSGYIFTGWRWQGPTDASPDPTLYAPNSVYWVSLAHSGGTWHATWREDITRTGKNLSVVRGNYRVITYYTVVYQGNVLKSVEYEVVAYKLAGTGYHSFNSSLNSWSVTIAGQTRSGNFTYDFRGKSSISLASGTINVNRSSFSNSISSTVILQNLGTFSTSGNLNK